MMCNNMIVINDDRNDHSNDDGNDDSNDDSNGNSNGDGDVDDANAFHETPMQPRYQPKTAKHCAAIGWHMSWRPHNR